MYLRKVKGLPILGEQKTKTFERRSKKKLLLLHNYLGGLEIKKLKIILII
jgi:hypothetical protein